MLNFILQRAMGFFNNQKDHVIKELRSENKRLVQLCNEKDSFFLELISDGLRHGSPLAAKHMSDRKKYLNGK